jgi:beta-lactam-binding protein with PASTA domain
LFLRESFAILLTSRKPSFMSFLRRISSVLLAKPFLYTVGSVVGLFVLANYVILPAYVNRGGTLTVPSVVGLPLPRALAVLDSAGLRPIESDTRPDPEYPPGIVVQQNPLSGAVVKEGRRVYLTMSGGDVVVPVPSLRGRSMRDARFGLERNGLKLGTVGYDTSETFPQNTIIDQSIPAETRVARGTQVSITVSRGATLRDRVVPNVTGKSLAEAEKLLQEAGLLLGKVTYQLSFDLVPNTVVDQFPHAGDPISTGEPVNLFVVKVGRPAEEIAPPSDK